MTVTHPNVIVDYFFFPLLFSRCDKALPAMLFVRELVRPSRNAAEALEATFAEVTFFAIFTSFLFLGGTCFRFPLLIIFPKTLGIKAKSIAR